jgi:hypothetical protein
MTASALLLVLLGAAPARAAWPWQGAPAAELTYEVEQTGKPSIDDALASRAAAVLKNRLASFGFDGDVEPRDGGRVVVTLRSRADDPEALLRPLLKPAKLDFHILTGAAKAAPGEITLTEASYDAKTGEVKEERRAAAKAAVLGGADIASAGAGINAVGAPMVHVECTAEGAKKLAAVSRQYMAKQLAIVVDGRILSAPVIRSPIEGGRLEVQGDFTAVETAGFAKVLASGPLPGKLTLVRKVIGGQSLPIAAPPSAVASESRPARAPAPFAPAAPAEGAPPVSDVDAIPAAIARAPSDALAVVIGVEHTRQGLPRADFAAKDARVFADYLVQTLGYRAQNVKVLLDERAAKSDLEKYLEDWLPRKAAGGASVVVFFSGHGAPDPTRGKAYLVPYDGDPAFLDKTAYPMARLTETLARLPGRSLVLVDACFSGAGSRSALAKGARPLVGKVAAPEPVGRVAVLSAAAGNQIGGAYPEKGHGLFTYFLLSAMRDAAAHGKALTAQELFDGLGGSVEATAQRLTGNEQTPQLQGSADARGNSL